MKDREFLMWLHERLTGKHKESPIVDYMHKLRAIIKNTPADKETANVSLSNSLHDLRCEIENES
jgi:hypothetical protein